MNTRSLGYLNLVFCDKSNSTIISSFPSSGWNWTNDVTTFAVVKHVTGEYNLTYKNTGKYKGSEVKPLNLYYPADSRATGTPLLTSYGIPRDYCLHTHGYRGESPLWGLNKAKTILIARDIPTALYSYYAKRRDIYQNFEDCLYDGILDRAVRFYESWSRTKQPLEIFWYKEFKANPVGLFSKFIKSAFLLDIPTTIVAEAVEFYSFENQKKREYHYNKDEKSHFHFKAKTSYRTEMGEKTYSVIQRRIKHITL